MARPTDKRWKGYLINWPTIAAMDAEDYELKPLNQQQVAILLMLLEYQKWETRWTNLELSKDELEHYIGDIEERLMRNEGGMATKEDIRDGMYEAFNRLALQVATGQYANIGLSTDEEGTVTPTPAGEEATLPEDDPATAIDESASAKSGGCITIARGVNAVIARSNTYFGADATADMTVAQAAYLIASEFKMDETLLTAALTELWAVKGASLGVIASLSEATLTSALYCRGISYQTINTIVMATPALSFDSRKGTADLVLSITQAQFDEWFARGMSVPSTDYIAYSCVPVDTETIVMNFATLPAGYSQNTSVVHKANHRLLIEATGSVTDTDNPNEVRDYLYLHNTSTNVKTFENSAFQLQYSSTNLDPTSLKVPYRSDHHYVFTIDTPATPASNAVLVERTTGSMSPPNRTGTITLKITDLGEIIA